MNSRDALDAPLFLLTDEERFRREQEERWRDAFDRAGGGGMLNATGRARVSEPIRAVEADSAEMLAGSNPAPPTTPSDRQAAVLAVLRDGLWHRTSEFLGPDRGGSEGMRRLRELSMKYKIERRKIRGSSQWEYRLEVR